MKRAMSLLLCGALICLIMSGCGVQEDLPEDTGEPEQVGETTQAPEEISLASAPAEAEEETPEEEPAEELPPDTQWLFDDPDNLGVDSAAMEAIGQKIARSQMLGVVVVKDGVVIGEYYGDDYDETSLFRMHSVTKSVSSALIGIAIDQGILEGVDVRLAEFFPQAANSDDDRMREITIRHLLEHTSGIGWGDTQSFQALVDSENWVDYYLSQPITAEPGTTFAYTTAGSHMLSATLEQASGVPTYDYAVEHLFGPLGIESFQWDTDPQGIVDGGNGLHMNVRDAAKLGQLYLEGGNWRGRQIVPGDWVEQSTQVQSAGEPDKGQYGYQWWLRSYGPNGEYSGYYALGYAGQFIFVVPELNLVTAVASRTIWSDYTAQMCIADIIAACKVE